MGTTSALNVELTNRYAKWLIAQRCAVVTRNQYCLAVHEYWAFLGKKSFIKSNHFDVQEFLASRAKRGVSARTLRGVLYSLRIFFDFLNLGGLVQWVPPRLVRPRPLESRVPRVPRVLTKEQVNKLFSGTRNRFERALLGTLYGTGCRIAEVRSMRVEDVDFVQHRMRVRGKSGDRFRLSRLGKEIGPIPSSVILSAHADLRPRVRSQIRPAQRHGREGVIRAVILTTAGPMLNISFGPKLDLAATVNARQVVEKLPAVTELRWRATPH
jgi:site-specific recombinase XerD